MQTGQTLTSALASVLRVDCAHGKATAVRQLVAHWQDGGLATIGSDIPPARPRTTSTPATATPTRSTEAADHQSRQWADRAGACDCAY